MLFILKNVVIFRPFIDADPSHSFTKKVESAIFLIEERTLITKLR